jgi:hypothetical protein
MLKPVNMLSSIEAKAILENGTPLENSTIIGVLNLDFGNDWNKKIVFENCTIENLSCIMIQFKKRITFRHCLLKKASFNFCYFLGGLTIENCSFQSYLDFEAGGHNDLEENILIKDNYFERFVNFFDCWFTGPISVINNEFIKGTNILSKDQYLTVDIPVFSENNVGDLGIESECREEDLNSLIP